MSISFGFGAVLPWRWLQSSPGFGHIFDVKFRPGDKAYKKCDKSQHTVIDVNRTIDKNYYLLSDGSIVLEANLLTGGQNSDCIVDQLSDVHADLQKLKSDIAETTAPPATTIVSAHKFLIGDNVIVKSTKEVYEVVEIFLNQSNIYYELSNKSKYHELDLFLLSGGRLVDSYLKHYEKIQKKKTQIDETASVANSTITPKQKFIIGDRVVPKYKDPVSMGKVSLGYYAQVIGIDFVGGDIYYKLDSGEVVHELDLYTISQSNAQLSSKLYNKLQKLRGDL
jgi:hypothetical protein